MKPYGYRPYSVPSRSGGVSSGRFIPPGKRPAVRSVLGSRGAPRVRFTSSAPAPGANVRRRPIPVRDVGFGTVKPETSMKLPPITDEFRDWLRAHRPSLKALLDRLKTERAETGMGSILTSTTSLVTDLAGAYKEFLAQKAAIEAAKYQAKLAQAQAASASAAQTTAMMEPPTYGDSLMDRLAALPLPVQIGGALALGYLGYSLIAGRRSR